MNDLVSPNPWSKRSRSVQGRKTEREVVKKRGGRPHPNSGAGSIKDDGSSEDELFEVKDANKSHTMNSTDLNNLLRRALAQGRDAKYIVYFREHDITATVTVTRGKG